VISVMREYARSLKILLLVVIVVFILTSGVLFYFGTGPFGSGRSTAVAVVNGEEIPFQRFQRAQSNIVAAYERTARQRLTPELAERLGAVRPGMRALFMSGYSDGTITDRGLLANGASLIQKPFSGDALKRAVRGALEQR